MSGAHSRCDERIVDGTSVLKRRLLAFLGLWLAMFLVSCGSSSPTPASTSTSTQSSWQVILTVKTAAVEFGIAGIAFDGKGNLYLTEMDDDLIYEYTTSGKLVRQWGGTGSRPGQLTNPEKLAFDAQGNLYVTEFGSPSYDGSQGGNDRVQKFSPIGAPLAQWGTLGSGPGQFNGPAGIAIDHQGDIYVADTANHRVQELSPSGQSLTQWHTTGSGIGDRTGTGFDLALDASGNVYVSEPHPFGSGNDQIQKFSPSGALLTTWGGTGTGSGQFSKPFCLGLDLKGNVFVVDFGNNRIQEFSSSGQYMAQWKGPQTSFLATSKLAVDDQGNMYASVGNQVVKLVKKSA
jgi:streptogramin lyase